MSSYAPGTSVTVTVQRVVDGDTVRVRRKTFLGLFSGPDIVVRLHGIDAPESDQRHGSDSARQLRKELSRHVVMEVFDNDQYGRVVALLYRAKRGREDSANFRMVKAGWAHAYMVPRSDPLGFRRAEMEAESSRRGMWRDGTVRRGKSRPWDHRRAGREREGARRRLKQRMAIVAVALLLMLAVLLWSVSRDGF